MRYYLSKTKDGIINIQVQPDNAVESEMLENVDENQVIAVRKTKHNHFNHNEQTWIDLHGDEKLLPDKMYKFAQAWYKQGVIDASLEHLFENGSDKFFDDNYKNKFENEK